MGDENVFDIKQDKGPDRGLDARAADPSIEVRCIVAGGDGTFSWVATAVEKKNLTHVNLIVIPLGSGNDMSRALGWGKKFPGVSRIVQYLDSIHTAKPHRLDVWRLSAVNDPSKVPKDHSEDAPGARPLVCNYLSLGADAFVELRFNQLRWRNPEKYKTRIGNLRAHFVVGAKYIWGPASKKFNLGDHIQQLIVDGEPIRIPDTLQALIFLNIPSYGAGTQPWGRCGADHAADIDKNQVVNEMYVDDHQFEVIGLRNLTQFGFIKVLGSHGIRIAQGSSMTMKLKSDSTPFQVDGEPWQQYGGEVTLNAGNNIGVLEGPVWNQKSKKNAKFHLDGDSSQIQSSTDDIPPPGMATVEY